MQKPLTRSQLLARIRRLEALLRADPSYTGLVHDLEVHREELLQQSDQLVVSQRNLEQSRDRYAELFDFSPVGHVVLDQHGVVRELNLAGAVLLGAERARLVGFPFQMFVVEAQRRAFVDYITDCRRGRSSGEIDLTVQRRGGEMVPIHMIMKPGVKDGGMFHAAILDMSDRHRLEDERRRAWEERRRTDQERELALAASEAKDRFIATLSHELRTPLTPILLAIASLSKSGAVPSTLVPAFDMIRRNVQIEARLIDDLLDVTRMTRGKLHLKLEIVDVHDAVQEVLVLCAEEVRAANLRAAIDLGATVHHVKGDVTRLRQVIWNLLTNAIRYTPAGGTITIRSANRRPDVLTLEVSDTGRGIPDGMTEGIFLPFVQAAGGSDRGIGLGLSICKGIVEAHGGTITASSDGAGRGSSFMIALSAVDGVSATEPPRPSPPRMLRPSRILLVEDNRDNAAAISELLRLHGYDVEVAGCVADALRQAQKGFDVLVSDIGLPDGTGRDVVRQLCTNGRMPAIALTGYGAERDMRDNAEAGFSRHLTKPVDPDELLATLADLTSSAAKTNGGG